MKKIITLLLSLSFAYTSYGQTCYAGVPANAIHLPNDTVIISQNSGPSLSNSYVPCRSLRIDSSITVQNRIYLRPGSSFTVDSLSTLFGGFFIYADSGATVDMNFKAALQLSYTTGSILIDTNGQSGSIFCSVLPFDFTNMIQSHSCFPLSTNEINDFERIKIATKASQWELTNIDATKKINWELFSLEGRLISKGNTTNEKLIIENADLVRGVYLLHLTSQGKSASFKLFND